MNFTREQRLAAREERLIYERNKDNLYDGMHRRLEMRLNLDPESVGRLLEEEK